MASVSWVISTFSGCSCGNAAIRSDEKMGRGASVSATTNIARVRQQPHPRHIDLAPPETVCLTARGGFRRPLLGDGRWRDDLSAFVGAAVQQGDEVVADVTGTVVVTPPAG